MEYGLLLVILFVNCVFIAVRVKTLWPPHYVPLMVSVAEALVVSPVIVTCGPCSENPVAATQHPTYWQSHWSSAR